MTDTKIVLITGAAKRVGAHTAEMLHDAGFNVAIHYATSKEMAEKFCEKLNQKRAKSAIALQCNLLETSKFSELIQAVEKTWGKLDVLINNASSFYPTTVGSVTETQWNDLMGTNLKAPFFLAQAAAPLLTQTQGCIINIADVQGMLPLKNYPVYSTAKAGLIAMTKVLAKELAPHIRVNAIAPGPILWPDEEGVNTPPPDAQEKIIHRTLLKRMGTPQDLANTVKFLIDSPHITGQIIAVEGGRVLST